MNKSIICIGLCLAITIHGSPAVFAESSCALVSDALRMAAEIRGLKLKRQVDCVKQSKDEVKAFILKSIDEQLTPEQIESDSTTYKALGIIPEDWEYKSQLVELYLSQIGGYYDPKKKRYVMADWLPDMLQTNIAVHELTHALQDQYYDLEKFHNDPDATTDEQMARAALIEGDATAVMIDHPRKMMNKEPLATLPDVENLVLQQTLSLALSPTIRNAPEAISYTILFPYASGLRFVHALLKKGGYFAIDKAYKSPPKSTEEILHPSKYLSKNQDYRKISDEEVLKSANLEGFEVVDSDTWGEFMLSMLLAQGNTKEDAATAARGWGGDRVVIAKNKNAHYVILLTEWDSPRHRLRFFQAAQKYKSHVAAKRKKDTYSAPTVKKIGSTGVLVQVKYKP